MYSKEIIEQVKSSVNIADVIGEYQSLTRRGKHYLGVCPFHQDSTPSLTVNPAMQIYKCFACGESGDVIKYVMYAESCSFKEAVQLLAKRAHISLPEDTKETAEERQKRIERETLLQGNSQRQKEYISLGWNAEAPAGTEGTGGRTSTWPLSDYLAQRVISEQAAWAFGLGYADKGEFQGRITYPIYTVSGQIAGWTGRIIGENKGPKYKNSAESGLFRKDELLFGLYQAKREIQRRDMVYIVEGQNDVIRMHICGYENTVAGSGTAFSDKQARLLQRFTNNIVLMYDGDAAGRKATLRTLRLLLPAGFSVTVVRLPEGEDPDSYLRTKDEFTKDEGASIVNEKIVNIKNAFLYLRDEYPLVADDAAQTAKNIEEYCKYIALVPDKIERRQLVFAASVYYKTPTSDLQTIVNRQKTEHSSGWQNGLYGLQEAKELTAQASDATLNLTFRKQRFTEHMEDGEPWVLYQGEASQTQVQQLRVFRRLEVDERELLPEGEMTGSEELQVARMLHADGQTVMVRNNRDEVHSFTSWFISQMRERLLQDDDQTSSQERTIAIRETLQVIADTDPTEREVNSAHYRAALGLQQGVYNRLLKELLQERKDRKEEERRRLLSEEKTTGIDLMEVPDYVSRDEVLNRQYNLYGFYPLMNGAANDQSTNESTGNRYVAYVFKNDKGQGHTIVSDFYMEPLLFVDPATDHSKRVIRINHLHGGQQYVEWPSDSFVSLLEIKKRLFSSGAYNFTGTPFQWDKIRQVLSYNFTQCYEARVFGWQPEGFLMLPNAVYYQVSDEGATDGGQWQLQYMDKLGVAQVNGMRFYSPAASQIRLSGRQEDNPYEQDEYAYFLQPSKKDCISFTDWADLMDRVFQVNDNGKWAVMFAIACSFRDLIYKIVGSFTALCFAGPTGSGKTELAYGIRGLWMRRKAAVFNLNSGSDAAFFIVLEHFRNMPVIMEEYNDNGISQIKFQGLKAAVYDDKGRTKVKDISSKSLDTSKTNAAPILLGQDTPQQDDGSLSNRVIICEVPKKEGGFTLEETERFERLKRLADTGLGNVLLDIIRQRPLFEEHFKQIFFEEVNRMKLATWDSTTNKEGLERVIRSVAILSATARLVEERCDIRLPWRYDSFYELAVNKIPKQMENISKTSKIGNFFQALNTLLSLGKVIQGREFKVERAYNRTIRVKDGIGFKEVEVGQGTLILYLQLEDCYHAYCKVVSGRDTLSKQTLTNYFRSHSAYIGQLKSTRFSWKEAEYANVQALDHRGEPSPNAVMQMQSKSQVTSAYVFNYEMLRELLDIDFIRQENETLPLPQTQPEDDRLF